MDWGASKELTFSSAAAHAPSGVNPLRLTYMVNGTFSTRLSSRATAPATGKSASSSRASESWSRLNGVLVASASVPEGEAEPEADGESVLSPAEPLGEAPSVAEEVAVVGLCGVSSAGVTVQAESPSAVSPASAGITVRDLSVRCRCGRFGSLVVRVDMGSPSTGPFRAGAAASILTPPGHRRRGTACPTTLEPCPVDCSAASRPPAPTRSHGCHWPM